MYIIVKRKTILQLLILMIFFESCREDLDELIGDDNVQKIIDLTDLYIEHFGFYQSDEFEHELMPIFLKSIECLIAMVIDYGGFY